MNGCGLAFFPLDLARNYGAQHATHDLILFLDSDIIATTAAVDGMREAFSNPQIAAVFGSYCDRPGHPGFLSQYRNLLHHHTHQQHPGPAAHFWSGFGAVRRAPFFAAKGFSSSYRRPCIEDIELDLRLATHGHRIELRPDLQVTHLKHWTARNMLRTDVLDRALPWSRLIVQRGAFTARLNTDWRAQLSAASLALIFCLAAVALFVPSLAPILLLPTGGYLTANHNFYRFLLKKKGWLFTLRVLPWRAVYYLTSATVFGLVVAHYHFLRRLLLPAWQIVQKSIPQAILHFAGDGPQLPELKAEPYRLKLGKSVRFHGHLTRPDLANLAQQAWLQLVPSQWEEPFGISCAEALMRGTPVLASQSGGLSEQILPGCTGDLISSTSPDLWAAKILTYLSDRALTIDHGQRARQHALEHFTFDRFLENWIAIYQDLLPEKPTA